VVFEFFDEIMTIAQDRKFGGYQRLNTTETKTYVGQMVKLLGIIHAATKLLEGNDVPTMAMVIPTILNALVEIERPEVRNFIC